MACRTIRNTLAAEMEPSANEAWFTSMPIDVTAPQFTIHSWPP
jgi:hypothetical protein